jgi:cation:H+ antiporter
VAALLFGDPKYGHDIGIGAIPGAPLMLSTLAFLIAGLAVLGSPGGGGADTR